VNLHGPDSVDAEIANALLLALEPVLDPLVMAAQVVAARDVSQVLSLRGLDRVLAAVQPQAGRSWPDEIAPALERVRRLAAESRARGSIEPFRAADRELDALATQIESLEWSETVVPGGRTKVPTLRLLDALDDLKFANGANRDRVRGTRLTAPVAAGLRAAMDWLTEPGTPASSLRVTAEESALEIVIERIHAEGLWASSQVLSSLGANLGPLRGRIAPHSIGAPWRIRVPAAARRAAYLMVEQGDARLAIPWHAVLQVLMIPADALDRDLSDVGFPLLDPLRPLELARSEHPVALIAHGLKRAYLLADHLIWRLEADPVDDPGPPPVAGLARAVRTDDDEIFWVAEPAWLLESIEMPALPDPPRRSATPDSIPVLTSQDVEPLGGSAMSTMTANALAASPAPTAERPARPRALLAEDSIGARARLARMLERHGFEVVTVGTAAEMLKSLAGRAWSLVCVDVDLPDARGDELLTAAQVAQPGAPVVALVRDESDREAAKRAGITRSIHKPFDPEAVASVLRDLGFDLEQAS
jgi:CheY-like chemotaxis protein